MVISTLQFIGIVAALVVAAWARWKFKSVWLKVLFFFVAMIAGNLVYLVLGIAWDLMNPTPSHAIAHEVGRNGWDVIGGTLVGAAVGLFTSFSDRFLRRAART